MEEILLCGECDINEEKQIKKHICKHNITRQICKICNPKVYCEHERIKYNCKECRGSNFCDHGRKKYRCKECGGSSFCDHGKEKYRCKECGGSGICEHMRIKIRCKECDGSSICIHKKIKSACKECGTLKLCEHNKIKYQCKDCKGSKICIHKKRKSRCIECGGSELCVHNRQKGKCKDCGGYGICEHNKYKQQCKICDGSLLCKSEWCEKTANKKYEGYCLFCYVNLFPDKPITRNYKNKEKDVVDGILKIFPNFTWICDKKVQDGCSKRRPDLLLDMGSHIIIVEIDENAHTNYDCSCENKRLMEISQDLGHRPIVFIRFNPDDYTDKEGNKIKSCWKLNMTTGLIGLDQKKIKEWGERINSLVEQINYWIKNPTEKTIEIVELFY